MYILSIDNFSGLFDLFLANNDFYGNEVEPLDGCQNRNTFLRFFSFRNDKYTTINFKRLKVSENWYS